uniref:Coiled-coil domain containing 106a n=1 Tax=Hucho hucho TaxID=62062 RepID=A0A4W5LPJ9_9TELE
MSLMLKDNLKRVFGVKVILKEKGGRYQDSINSDSLNSDSLQGGVSACHSSPGGERILGRSSEAKGGDSSQTRDSCDFSNCSDDNTEEDNRNLFDIVCESSAMADEDGDVDYEPRHRPRKRGPLGGMPGPQGPGSEDRGHGDKSVKKIKQETAEEYYTVPKAQQAAGGGTDSGMASDSVSQSTKPDNSLSQLCLSHTSPHKPLPKDSDCFGGGVSSSPLGHSSPHIRLLAKPLQGSVSKPSVMSSGSPRHQDSSLGSTHCPRTLPGAAIELSEDLLKPGGSEGPFGDLTPSSPSGMNPDLDLLGAETKGEATVGPALYQIERLRALLSVERCRSEQMGETISSLKQDKELLQQELTKKAELICDFLQDQLRPEKRCGHSSSQVEVGLGSSTHMGVGFPYEGMAIEHSAVFESFEEVEIHPLDRHRVMKSSKRSRDGENTRVRMKNVVGVIARYMAALQEFRLSVSMKVAFDRVGVDRNTISRTAAIAELSLAAPEVFHALPPWDEKEETLAHYAHRCRQAMDDTIRAKIKTMKTKGDLLPIVSK